MRNMRDYERRGVFLTKIKKMFYFFLCQMFSLLIEFN
jgi:hypothetical protein